jgi:hypothetical protein
MKKIALLTLIFSVLISAGANAQFGIERSIKKKFEKKGMEHAEKEATKGTDAAEKKGMEEADKGLDKATEAGEPGIQKAEEGMEKAEESAVYGLGKYQEFTENYEADVESKDPADYKKYPFTSAKVEYTFEGSEDGSRIFYVEMGGYKTADYKTVKERKNNKKTAQILIGSEMISVDFENKSAVKMHNPAAYLLANPNRDWVETGENMLVNLGYEKIDKESIAGKKCDIWKQGRHKIWVWDGLTLKSEHGKNIETATKIEIDVDVDEEIFNAPEGFDLQIIGASDMFPDLSEGDFEEDEMTEEEMNELLDEIEKMSYQEYKEKVLEEEPNADDEKIKQSYLLLRQQAKRRHR